MGQILFVLIDYSVSIVTRIVDSRGHMHIIINRIILSSDKEKYISRLVMLMTMFKQSAAAGLSVVSRETRHRL